jgi:hypothetical protein
MGGGCEQQRTENSDLFNIFRLMYLKALMSMDILTGLGLLPSFMVETLWPSIGGPKLNIFRDKLDIIHHSPITTGINSLGGSLVPR